MDRDSRAFNRGLVTCWTGDSRCPHGYNSKCLLLGGSTWGIVALQSRTEQKTGAGGFAQKSRNCRADEAGPLSGKLRQGTWSSVGYWEGYLPSSNGTLEGLSTVRAAGQNQRF